MNVRQKMEQREEHMLCCGAMLSKDSKGRESHIEECSIRTCFQRDKDRIIHSKSFRRLKHKTQVFISPEGDHYRTRLTHTLEVSQIARTIARALDLNEDLIEAISLGHDLGHTPFGHAGERALNEISSTGFMHNMHSIRIVRFLERDGQGLNLTHEVLDGIKCHNGDQDTQTLEGKIVQYADKIAYINHDIDDSIRAGIIKNSDIPSDVSCVLGESHGERINTMVRKIVEFGIQNGIGLDKSTECAMMNLRDFMFTRVYMTRQAKNEEQKIFDLIFKMYSCFYSDIDKLPKECLCNLEKDGKDQVVCDYIAGMTDRFAIARYQQMVIPKSFDVD